MGKKMLNSKIHNSWVHDPCSDQFPRSNLSQGHMRGKSWHVRQSRGMIGGKYLCCFLQSEEKEVFRVIKVFKYKLKKTSGSRFWQMGKPRAEIKRFNLLQMESVEISKMETRSSDSGRVLVAPLSLVKTWLKKILIWSGLLGFQNQVMFIQFLLKETEFPRYLISFEKGNWRLYCQARGKSQAFFFLSIIKGKLPVTLGKG